MISLEHITLYVKWGLFFFRLLLYLHWISSIISWLFSLRYSFSPSVYYRIAHVLRRLLLHSLPLVLGCLWIQCIAEHCKRLPEVSLPGRLDCLCLLSAVLAGSLVQMRVSPFILRLRCCPCSAALMLPCIAVQSLLWTWSVDSLFTESFCPSSQHWLLLPLALLLLCSESCLETDLAGNELAKHKVMLIWCCCTDSTYIQMCGFS